jgi:hypothetical protein
MYLVMFGLCSWVWKNSAKRNGAVTGKHGTKQYGAEMPKDGATPFGAIPCILATPKWAKYGGKMFGAVVQCHGASSIGAEDFYNTPRRI